MILGGIVSGLQSAKGQSGVAREIGGAFSVFAFLQISGTADASRGVNPAALQAPLFFLWLEKPCVGFLKTALSLHPMNRALWL
jgi:hypothetical protein